MERALDLEHGEEMDGYLRVRPHLDGRIAFPDLVHVDLREVARSQLANRVARAVGRRNHLEVDVRPERQLVEGGGGGRPLLVRHRRGQQIDAVARHAADEQVAVRGERDGSGLLRLAEELAARGDRRIRLEHEHRRVRAFDPGRVVPDRDVHGELAVRAEPVGIVEPVDVDDRALAAWGELLGEEACDPVGSRPVGDRHDLDVAEATWERRHGRRDDGHRLHGGLLSVWA